MTNQDQEKAIDRVRKMMRLANNSGATEGERDNALRMARATLAKYNLDMAAVEETTGQAAEDRGAQRMRFYGRPWARSVAASAAELCFCSYLYVAGHKATDTVHLFIGREANAITASELAQYLVESISREAKRHQRQHGLSNDSYRSFAWGAAGAVMRRCRVLRAAAETSAETPATSPAGARSGVQGALTQDEQDATSSGALVAYQASEAQANQSFIDEHIKPKTSRNVGKSIGDGDAMSRGRSYGETVSLNRQVGSESAASRFRLTGRK